MAKIFTDNRHLYPTIQLIQTLLECQSSKNESAINRAKAKVTTFHIFLVCLQHWYQFDEFDHVHVLLFHENYILHGFDRVSLI